MFVGSIIHKHTHITTFPGLSRFPHLFDITTFPGLSSFPHLFVVSIPHIKRGMTCPRENSSEFARSRSHTWDARVLTR